LNLKELKALERKWQKGVYRVTFQTSSGTESLPDKPNLGMILDEAFKVADRLRVVAALKGIDKATIKVVGPDGQEPASILPFVQPVRTESADPVKQFSLSVKQRKGLTNLDNVDLDLLVNPEALEEAAQDDEDA
jgi:hypothetical protein